MFTWCWYKLCSFLDPACIRNMIVNGGGRIELLSRYFHQIQALKYSSVFNLNNNSHLNTCAIVVMQWTANIMLNLFKIKYRGKTSWISLNFRATRNKNRKYYKNIITLKKGIWYIFLDRIQPFTAANIWSAFFRTMIKYNSCLKLFNEFQDDISWALAMFPYIWDWLKLVFFL